MKKSWNSNKMGLSTIIVTLILIVISLAAIGVFWLIISNVIKGGSEQIGLDRFTVNAEIKNVNINNVSNNVSLTFKRKAGPGQLSGIKFVFSDQIIAELTTEEFTIKELEERNFMFHLSKILVDDLYTITIFPILIEDDGDIITGNSLGVYDVRNDKCWIPHHPGCTPTTCLALGYECGTHSNGTCAGTLDCGACGSEEECVSGTCYPLGSEEPADSDRFYIRDSLNNPIAWLGNQGNIVLGGRCFSGASCNNPGDDSFIIGNLTDSTTAFINSSGDLCIEKGDCSDESSSCNPIRNAFIIKDSTNQNRVYIDYDGDLCLTGQLYENSEYV